jgi:DNA-binding XRE family transcriptional regulator
MNIEQFIPSDEDLAEYSSYEAKSDLIPPDQKSIEDYAASIGKLIVKTRKRKNIAQEELALACGVSRSTMGRLETNPSKVSFDLIIKVCIILEINLFKAARYNDIIDSLKDLIEDHDE